MTDTRVLHGNLFQDVSLSPAIVSANSVSFTVGVQGTFTVIATGNPAPTLTETGALPSGVTFNAQSGVLSGTPATGTGGTVNMSYPIQFTATNGVGSTAVQNFTLTVVFAFRTAAEPAPELASANCNASEIFCFLSTRPSPLGLASFSPHLRYQILHVLRGARHGVARLAGKRGLKFGHVGERAVDAEARQRVRIDGNRHALVFRAGAWCPRCARSPGRSAAPG